MGKFTKKNGATNKSTTNGRRQGTVSVIDELVSRDTLSPSVSEADSEDSGLKRKYDTISDEDRLKLILLIKEFGMSCHKASKVLKIAYNNAKVIYRIFKNEQRIRQTPKQQKRHAKTIRADTLREKELARAKRVEALMLDESSETEDEDFDQQDE